MHALFKRMIDQHVPHANPAICDGLAETYLPFAEQYIDTVFQSASKSFPQGLVYVGYERCTPTDEFNEITRPKNNKRTYDLARSDLYLVKYHFKFNNVELPPRYIQLPYVTEAGIIHLGGSTFHISPVLTDKVISPGVNSIFVRLLRDKVNFERCNHTLKVDGVRDTTQIVWSKIYRKPAEVNKTPTTTRAYTCVVHYLLAKYGYSEMFRRFVGFVPVIGEDEITLDKYPKDEWVICESSKVKPKTFIGEFYEPTKLKIAVPRGRWSPLVYSFIAGLFYTIDHFPDRVKPSFVDHQKHWMVLLGNIIFSGVFGAGKLHEGIREHFSSLDEYVDSIVIMKLKEIGYDIQDFYELLVLILTHFNEWVVMSSENSISMHGKTMEVLYYALFDITASIFKTNFRLNKVATKKQLTPKEIIETMNKHLKTGAIFGLARANIAVASVSYSGDNKYPKLTAVIAQQQSSAGASRGRKTRTVVDASKRVHVTHAESGSLLFLSKSNPTPAVRANLFAKLDISTGTIIPKPEFADLMRRTEQMFKSPPDPSQKPFV